MGTMGWMSKGKNLNAMATCEYFLDAIYKHPLDS